MRLLSTAWARRALACGLLDHSLAAVALGAALTVGIAALLRVWH